MATFDKEKYIINLQGNDYLPVAPRIAWFRAEHPYGRIITDVQSVGDVLIARARVIIRDENGQEVEIATGSATVNEFKRGGTNRGVEKAETAAIGRALAVAGFGTLQAGEDLEEGAYLADTPIATNGAKRSITPKYNETPAPPATQPAPDLKEVFPRPDDDDAPPEEVRETLNAVQVEIREDKNQKPYLYLHLEDDNGRRRGAVNLFTRELFRQAGYTVDEWQTKGAKFPVTPPARVTTIRNGRGRDVVAITKPAAESAI